MLMDQGDLAHLSKVLLDIPFVLLNFNINNLISGECYETQFQCRGGKCKYDEDDDDECTGSCIPKDWVNDGIDDCTDGSDEVIGKSEPIAYNSLLSILLMLKIKSSHVKICKLISIIFHFQPLTLVIDGLKIILKSMMNPMAHLLKKCTNMEEKIWHSSM